MLERRLVSLLGTTAKHLLGGLLHAIRSLLIASVLAALIAAIATEIAAFYLTHQLFSGPADLAAAALAVVFGYAAGVTVAIEEIIRAFIKAIELIVEEAEKVEKKAAEEIGALSRKAEEEAINLGRGALNDAGAVGHTVTGAVGSVIGGVEHDAARVGSHLPGHHSETTTNMTQGTTQG
jgi:predicted PurR-regulated permease PerM